MKRLPIKPLLTAGAVFFALAAAAFLPGLVVLPLHEDVAYVTAAASNLIHDGNLKNAGLFFAFQSLRPSFQSTQPFYAHYLAPVLYFWPFIKVLGDVDAAFYLGQAVLLVLLGTLLARAGLGWRGSILAISISVLSRTLIGTLITSPTQLLTICLIAYFWRRWEKPGVDHAYADGLTLAAAAFCRPEALFIGLLSAARNVWIHPDRRERLRFITQSAGAALLAASVLSALRYSLGAASDSDNKLLLLMADVLAPRFDVLGVAHFPPLSALLSQPAYFSAFCRKVLRNLSDAFSPGSMVWGQFEISLILIPFLLKALRLTKLRTYLPVFLLLGFQLAVNAALIPLARHYDPAFFLLLCAVVRDLLRVIKRQEIPGSRFYPWVLAAAGCWAMTVSLSNLPRRLHVGLETRAVQLAASEEAHRLVPRDAFVISDMPELWLWYGRGKMACFIPGNNPETLGLVLKKFPEAYMVMFLGDTRAGYPLKQFQRPLVFSKHPMTIYGPIKR